MPKLLTAQLPKAMMPSAMMIVMAFSLSACFLNKDKAGADMDASGLEMGPLDDLDASDETITPYGADADIGAGTLGDPAATGEGAGDVSALNYLNQSAGGDRVFFAVNQHTLSDEGRTILGRQAEWLKANPSVTITIEGHTDERGTREYNLSLGARRAAAAQDYLITLGIAPNRIRIVSYGKERPIELCSFESCYTKNRRAVTRMATGGAGQ